MLKNVHLSDSDIAMLLGVFGFLGSWLLENTYEVFRWAAVIVPTSYALWRWRRDIKKDKKSLNIKPKKSNLMKKKFKEFRKEIKGLSSTSKFWLIAILAVFWFATVFITLKLNYTPF